MSRRKAKPLHKQRVDRRTKPGERPGALVTDPDAAPPKISVFLFDHDRLVEGEVKDVSDLRELTRGWHVAWVNVVGLGDAKTIAKLGEIFRLHPLALEDVVNTHQRAKAEDYDDILFIVARMVTLDEHLHSEQLSIFLSPSVVVTFQEHEGDCFDPIRARLRKNSGKLRTSGADYLAYTLLDTVIDNYYPVLEEYGERIDRLEERIYSDVQRQLILDVVRIRKDLLNLRRALWPHREMISRLVREPLPLFSDNTRLYLRDCYDHVVHLVDLTETFREMVSDLRDTYLTALGNRTNETMRVLTLIATIFIPLTFIAGVYGMNFDPSVSPYNMPELRWYYGYPFALGMMGVFLGLSLLYYYSRGWIRLSRRAAMSKIMSEEKDA